MIIILTEQSGDHSNRLFQATHFEAYALEHGHKFLNFSFYDMQKYYPNAHQNKLFFFTSIAAKALRKFKINIAQTEFKSYHDKPYISNNIPVLLVGGWSFRAHALTSKYQDYFIRKYSIDSKICHQLKLYHLIKQWKQSGSKIIGVHIRRGDYKTWLNGKYYYPDSVYITALTALIEQIKVSSGQDSKVISFSNEKTYLESNFIDEASKNSWNIDHHLMSCCDYLIGPPSTFTMWASYIGKNQYFHIEEASQAVKLENFRHCIG